MNKDAIDFLPAALEIQERPPSPAGRAIVWSIMLFFSIAVAWAFLGDIDIVTTAQGKIIPSDRVKTIQPFEIGSVQRIHVHEGQQVKAGDLLIELDATSNEADLGRLEQELMATQLDRARFEQLLQLTKTTSAIKATGKPLSFTVPTTLIDSLDGNTRQLQTQLLQSTWNEHQSKVAALNSALQSRQADYAATREEVKKYAATLPLITRRTNALKQMLDKNLGSEQTWLELEEERVTQQQDLATSESRLRQVFAAIQEAKQQREVIDAEFLKNTLIQLSDTERRIVQLTQEKVKASQRTYLQRLTAPVNGVVQQLAIHTVGGVVTPAQKLMKIVPETATLEVEAWILNKDIGFVDEGQIAEIKIETFPFTKYGTIDAQMLDVSNDAVTDEEQGLVYAARVLMKQSVIQVGEKLVNLTPGMSVTVEIKTGKRKLIEFILSPLLRYKQESLGER